MDKAIASVKPDPVMEPGGMAEGLRPEAAPDATLAAQAGQGAALVVPAVQPAAL
jgi:hypothetical protein